jgi:hypothetical protein
MFENTRVGAFFLLEHAVLGGKANERHGFFAPDLSVHGTMIWRDVSLENVRSLIYPGPTWGLFSTRNVAGLPTGRARPFTRGMPSCNWPSSLVPSPAIGAGRLYQLLHSERCKQQIRIDRFVVALRPPGPPPSTLYLPFCTCTCHLPWRVRSGLRS